MPTKISWKRLLNMPRTGLIEEARSLDSSVDHTGNGMTDHELRVFITQRQ